MKYKIIILLLVFLLICVTLYFLRRVPEPPLPALIESVLLEKEVGGLSKNLSGLTWDATTETLMAVINSPARVVQLNTNGDVLQQFELPNMVDTESLSFLSGRSFLIAEERERRITLTSLSLDDKRAFRLAPGFVFDLGGKRNEGLEGWICPYISIHLLLLNPLLVRRRRYSRGDRYPTIAVSRHFTDNSMDAGQCFSIIGLTFTSTILPVIRTAGYRMKLRT